MREPPGDLSDDALRASLRVWYGLEVADLTFLPLGYDASAGVYRVRTVDGTLRFLKVRRAMSNEPGLLVPRHLHDQGIPQVVAPHSTTSGSLWAQEGGYALILYPFVVGTTGMVQSMTPSQWISYGNILRQIHGTPLTSELARRMHRETFVPVGAGPVRRAEAWLDQQTFDDPVVQSLVDFWQVRREEIRTLVARAEELGQQFARRAPKLVLCHADIHTANVMLDSDGGVWIVDWEETVLAPRERDLMFAVGGGISLQLVGPREEELFLQGYGATAIDLLGLAYYRYAWAVSDIGAYAEEVFFRPDLGPVTRHDAVRQFMLLFEPGQIVALALAAVFP